MLGLGLHFLEADFWVFVADLVAGELENFEAGLDKLGWKFSEFVNKSSVFDLFGLGSFTGVLVTTAPAVLTSIGKVSRKVVDISVTRGYTEKEGVKKREGGLRQ